MNPVASNHSVGADVAAFLSASPSEASAERHLRVPGWSESDWATLFSFTTLIELNSGDVLIEQDASDRVMYFAVAGKLKIAVLDEVDSSVTDITTISPGSVVGDFSFFDGRPRSAKVWAVTGCRLLRLSLQDYERYRQAHLDSASRLLFALARLLAMRARQANFR